MEKSESSDSDSNCSTSWVLVYDNTPPLENANPFHLDCSREPIQELTEQDLLSAGSDLESDTDGVSVISESEAPQEEFKERTCEETSDPNDNINECVTLSGHISRNKYDKPLVTATKKLFKNANIVGVGVVLTAVFLGSYTMIIKRNSVKETNINQKHCIAYKDSNVLSNSNFGLEEIVDMTIACTYQDQVENIEKSQEIKQCVKVQYENKKSSTDSSKMPLKLNENDIQMTDKISFNEELRINQKPENEEQKLNIEIIDNKKSDAFIPKHNKTKKYIKERKLYRRHRNTITAQSTRKLKGRLTRKFIRINSGIPKGATNTSKDFEDLDISGEWYNDWHKARRQLRKHDFIDEHYPNKKKTKMQWYFKWMSGREQLRYKKNYRPYSS
ncbi:hypothetical protein FQR65_LT18960 [Abscondita terminalis]|nr:hypothetical protein FQR65_LT18960 [Abscondita terminalis]